MEEVNTHTHWVEGGQHTQKHTRLLHLNSQTRFTEAGKSLYCDKYTVIYRILVFFFFSSHWLKRASTFLCFFFLTRLLRDADGQGGD